MSVEDALLAALRKGPVKAQDCHALRIAPGTLKVAVWNLRRAGHAVLAEQQPRETDTLRRNVYRLAPSINQQSGKADQ